MNEASDHLGTPSDVPVSVTAGELMILRKARDNKVYRHEVDGRIFDSVSGRPLKPWLLPHFDRLFGNGHVAIVRRCYDTGVSERVELTPLGRQLLSTREREWRDRRAGSGSRGT